MKPILLLVVAALALDVHAQTNTALDTNSVAARARAALRNTNRFTPPTNNFAPPTLPMPTVRPAGPQTNLAQGATVVTNAGPTVNTTVVTPAPVVLPAPTAPTTVVAQPQTIAPPPGTQVPTRTAPPTMTPPSFP